MTDEVHRMPTSLDPSLEGSRPSNPDAVKLAEAAREYAAEHDKDIWCQRIKYGQCALRKCNIEGGWDPNSPPDYSKATCSRYRLECALRQPYPAPDVERVALEIMRKTHCGFSSEKGRVLCDDPILGAIRNRECDCRIAAQVAITALTGDGIQDKSDA